MPMEISMTFMTYLVLFGNENMMIPKALEIIMGLLVLIIAGKMKTKNLVKTLELRGIVLM
jgi:hypothetical protein